MLHLSRRVVPNTALPDCLAVRSASVQQAEFGVGVNLNNILICLLPCEFEGVGGMEESSVLIIEVERVLLRKNIAI